jgi:hypothetical protein
VTDFKPGDTVSFTDKHLRERIDTITRLKCQNLLPAIRWRAMASVARVTAQGY